MQDNSLDYIILRLNEGRFSLLFVHEWLWMRAQDKMKERRTQQSDIKKDKWFTYSTSAREKEARNRELFGYVASPSNQSRNLNRMAIYIR